MNLFQAIGVACRVQPKPRLSYDQIFKKHEYPGYINMINSCNRIDDLEYIRQDLNVAMLETIANRIEMVEKYGDCEKTAKYYKVIKSMYIDKGITAEDCRKYDKWCKTVAREALNKRMKELRAQQKEKE